MYEKFRVATTHITVKYDGGQGGTKSQQNAGYNQSSWENADYNEPEWEENQQWGGNQQFGGNQPQWGGNQPQNPWVANQPNQIQGKQWASAGKSTAMG